MPKPYSLFQVFGIESEYMIVDRETLKVKAITDQVLTKLNNGELSEDIEIGPIAWSNELVNHVIEIKNAKPTSELKESEKEFHRAIVNLNKTLATFNCVLMPTAMHPWFDPNKETMLWPHDNGPIYAQYNKIFDCRGHGWSNLQSVHINLPYKDEEEFRILHAAIRVVLPLIPYMAASSPYYEGKQGKVADNRLAFYEANQRKVPSIAGNIIPEKIKSFQQYREILQGIYRDISIYEGSEILQKPFLNSRGAIIKFDYNALEIRLMDIQESPYMDYCLIHFFVTLIKNLTLDADLLKKADEISDKELRLIYEDAKQFAEKNVSAHFAQIFGLKNDVSFNELVKSLIDQNKTKIPDYYLRGLTVIAKEGNLAKRIVKKPLKIETYQKLINCLQENTIYE